MFHVCFTPNYICFAHTVLHFYIFSGTNLLTRCHSASSCFLLFLVSEKLFWKYSRNRTKQNPRCLFFPTRSRSPKRRRRGQQGALTLWRRGWAPCRATLWGTGPAPPPTSPLRLFIPPDAKTLKHRAIFPENIRCRRRQP